MKIAFWLGTIVGFGGLLAAAHLYPWVAHARLPSQTTVVANGGRAEQFLIRLPVDRIGGAESAAAGVRGAAAFASMQLPEPLASEDLLIEHFKVRDTAGNVIGLAARHWTRAPEGPTTAWSLLIPSRGALMLAAPGEPREAIDAALQRAGYRAGAAWEGDTRIDLARGDDGARVVAGSDEFDTLQGRYTETWHVTGVDPRGELRGTVTLDTVTYRAP